MPSIADFLGGATSPPGSPQPGANDPGYEQRKQGWRQVLDELVNDPVSLGMMAQMGQTFANPHRGQSVAGTISEGMTDALRYKGRYGEMEREAGIQNQRQEREDRRVDLEERRADQADSQFEFEQDKWKDQYGLRKREIAARERQAATSAQQSGFMGTERERLAGKLKAADPTLTDGQAMAKANEILNRMTPSQRELKYFNALLESQDDRRKEWDRNSVFREDNTPTEPWKTPEELMQQAREMVQREEGGSPAPTMSWMNVPQEKRLQALLMVEAGQQNKDQFAQFFGVPFDEAYKQVHGVAPRF